MSYTWEYDFLKTAADIFKILVLGLLPVVSLIIFTVYMKKIITTWFEMHRIKMQIGSAKGKGRR